MAIIDNTSFTWNTAEMVTERLHWIDIAKGIGIILVVFGHTLGANSIRHIFYAFHMPLFFFLSGILSHHKRQEQFLPFLKKNMQGVLIPYFIFAFLSLAIWYFGNEHPVSQKELHKQLFGIFFGNSNNGYLGFNVSLWFLPCLFVVRIGFWIITALSEKRTQILGALLILSVAGYVLSRFFPDFILPFGAESAVTGIVFFGLGYLWNSNPRDFQTFFTKHKMMIAAVSIAVCVVVAQITFMIYGFQIDVRLNRLNNYPLFYIGALSGIVGTLALSYFLKRNAVLEYLGKNSLVLFVWHTVAFVYIAKILTITGINAFLSNIKGYYLPLFYTAASISLILSITMLFRKLHLKSISIK